MVTTDLAQLCLKSGNGNLDRVSTGSGSDLVKRWELE